MASPEVPGQTGIDLPNLPDVPPVAVPQAEGVRWSRYNAKVRRKCDHCVQVMYDDPHGAPASRLARWHRKGQGLDELLCDDHADKAREVDGYVRKDDRWVKGDKA